MKIKEKVKSRRPKTVSINREYRKDFFIK